MTIEITSILSCADRRALDRFFERAYDSDEYATTGKRRAGTDTVDVALRDNAEGYSIVGEAHKLARRAAVAIGRTFNYQIERTAL